MRRSPKGFRIHVALVGRRNVGKSSLLNALTGQAVSIVSEAAGTTTDPVEKPMEMLPLGPVLFIDTAGIDDEGSLGQKRIDRTRQVLDRTDLGIVVAQGDAWGRFEEDLLNEFQSRDVPVLVVFNKRDLVLPESDLLADLGRRAVSTVVTQATDRTAVDDVRKAILQIAPDELLQNRVILADLVGAGGLAVLVTPIDKEAPRGRLILPQVQAIRDLLDHRAHCLVVQDDGLADALDGLKRPPRLVVTDSQAFDKVARITPDGIPLTSFSILFARFKGDLEEQVKGAATIGALRAGDRVLVAESCTHHPIEDDIGTVKLPRWLNKRVGGELTFEHVRGHDFPEDLTKYRLVIHCGACMWNRREVLTRIFRCRRADVPVTNYGLAIAFALGILERALAPFPEALRLLKAEDAEISAQEVAPSAGVASS